MARYIDADNLIAHLKDEIEECEIPFGSRANGKSIAYGSKLGLKMAVSYAETLSAEDVAPRSKVAEDLLSELKKDIHNKAVFPGTQDVHPYISLKVLDGIIQKYINRYYEEGKGYETT